MNKLQTIVIAIALLGTTQMAQASDHGIYLGAAVGNVEASVNKDTAKGLAGDFNGHDAAYKAILGIRPLDWLGAEINYLDLGKPDSGIFATDSTALSGYAVGFASMGPLVDLFAKAGLVNWKSRITAGSRELLSRDGTDLAYGAGVIVHLFSLSVRAEYEHFDIDKRAHLVSLGLTWTFL
ncbi:MAG: outer membrane beta-barrel protein [Steroidobacteraceae bacterium]